MKLNPEGGLYFFLLELVGTEDLETAPPLLLGETFLAAFQLLEDLLDRDPFLKTKDNIELSDCRISPGTSCF